MIITREEARRAGELTNQVSWTDRELKQVITFLKLGLAFLEGKGQRWHLAVSPLRTELEQFESFRRARQDDAKRV